MRKASNLQQKAIMHGNGPARVLAGPGSGKTFTIIQRIYYLITHYHISPDKILCVTFTKAAALEMEQRFYHNFPDVSHSENKKVQFGTLHSLCYQILRESGDFYQYSLVSENTKRNIIKQLFANEAVMQEADYDMITNLLSAISKRKNIPDAKPPVFLTDVQFDALYCQYESMLQERKVIDFDDMIIKAYQLLLNKKTLLQRWQSAFLHILVDEFQDMNENQYKIVRLLAEPQKNLFIVGDDDQSIYGFRGASPGIMKQFAVDYPNINHLFLSENYRSGNQIVTLANTMIKQNKDRLYKKPIPMRKGGGVEVSFQKSRKEEEEILIRHLKQLSFKQLTESAVILRTNREVFQYASLLKQAKIPIKEQQQEETDYLHHFIMEDICAFLKFIREGGYRENFLKFVNKPERYFSRQAFTEETVQLRALLRYYQNNQQMQHTIQVLFNQINKAAELSAGLAVRYFRQVIGYDRYLEETANTIQEKELFFAHAKKVQDLFMQMKEKEKVDSFCKRKETELSAQTKDNISYTKGVSVMTMHSVKGLEFTYVFLPDLNEGVIPGKTCKSQESMEEERRLLYVAITRAREFLYLYYTCERNRKPTRFLKEFLINHS